MAAAHWCRLAAVLDDGLGLSGDERVGVRVVAASLSRPLRAIADNAGAEGGVIVAKAIEQSAGHGFDASSGEWGDLRGGWDCRPGQGHPVSAGECGIDRCARLDHGGARGGEAGTDRA